MSKLDSSPTEEIVAQVNNLGLKRAAAKLNTSPATLSRWLKSQHFKIKRIYIREEQPPAAAPVYGQSDPAKLIRQVLQEQLEAFSLADGAEITIEEAS